MTAGDALPLAELRRELHRIAELAGEERQTRARLLEELAAVATVEFADSHGVAALIEGAAEGPTVMIRADMDGLPIDEATPLEYRSHHPGRSHKCGHDGHMSILAGLVREFARTAPARGRLVALFQPAEETGEGARAVLGDPVFESLRPDLCLALHNLPGFPLGDVILRPGPFACASRGLEVRLHGATSHAAEPELGRTPALAVAQVIQNWSAARQVRGGLYEAVQATVIHARVGRPAFGTSPGEGTVMATLRAPSDEAVERLESVLRTMAEGAARAHDLECAFEHHEPFPATVNDPELVEVITRVATAQGRAVVEPEQPFAWSEDFGHYGSIAPAVLFGLGAGEEQPALHHPDYDFPDALIPVGVAILEAAVRHWLGRHD